MPARHWMRPSPVNVAPPFAPPRYVNKTYCGRIIVESNFQREQWGAHTTLANQVSDAQDDVTCKACLNLGPKR